MVLMPFSSAIWTPRYRKTNLHEGLPVTRIQRPDESPPQTILAVLSNRRVSGWLEILNRTLACLLCFRTDEFDLLEQA